MLPPSSTVGFDPKSGEVASNFMPKNPFEREIDKEILKRAKAIGVYSSTKERFQLVVDEVLKECIETGYNAQHFSAYLRDYLRLIKTHSELKANPDVLKIPER